MPTYREVSNMPYKRMKRKAVKYHCFVFTADPENEWGQYHYDALQKCITAHPEAEEDEDNVQFGYVIDGEFINIDNYNG